MKKGAMEISFGMIFSIILIIAFIAFAFYAIKALLGTQDQVKVGRFVDDLKSDVDKVWRGTQASQSADYSLPKSIEKVCFADNEDFGENLILEPNDVEFPSIKIEHIDLIKMLNGEKMLCFNNNGKVRMILSKNYGEDLVAIKNV